MHDFIIVGAGSAGCVLANRLSADPNHRVLLLEAGADDRRKEISIPAAWPKLFKSDCDWAYETEPNPQMNSRRIFVPRGKCLGGTSSMNAMVYIRGHREDFDEWAAAGNPGWSYEEVLEYFKKSEDNSRGASEYHGVGGPLAVSDARSPNPIAEAFVESAAANGVPRNPDFNGASLDGVGFVQVTARRGRRCSTADAFLRPILHRKNLEVITRCQATRVKLEQGRAIGIEYLRNGRLKTAHAEREVILSCGTIDSPKVLLLSGIGPAEDIRRHGVACHHDLPGVGRNLQEHPLGVMFVRCAMPVSLLSAESPANLLRYLLLRQGMLTSNGPEAAAFVRTRSGLSASDVEIVVVPVLFMNEGLTAPTEHGFSIATVLLKPQSRGYVTLRSADPMAPPAIYTNHFSDPGESDLETIVRGMRIARELCHQAPLSSLAQGELVPGAAATTDSDLRAAVRANGQTAWHPVGTCRMGGDAWSVVSPELKVHGVERLRVIDASVMPSVIRGHTNAPTIMLAEKGADLILGRGAPAPRREQEPRRAAV